MNTLSHSAMLTTSPIFKLSTRYLHTSPFRHANYGILVGGGTSGRIFSRIFREHLPEIAEYNDIKQVSQTMQLAGFADVKILFGDGQATRALNRPGIVTTLFSKIARKENTIEAPLLENVIGKASVSNFENTISTLAQKMARGDRLWIYASAHGMAFRGVSLWNDWQTTQFLTPHLIKDQLKKLPDGVFTTLFIESCCSGSFQALSSTNVCVLSSSDVRSPSWYTPGVGSAVTPYLCQFFSKSNTELLTLFSTGNAQAGNYKAIDSLTYYLNKHFASNALLLRARLLYESNMQILLNKVPPGATTAFIMAFLIAFDPTGIIEFLWHGKLGLALGKISLIYVKIIFSACFSGVAPNIEKQLYKTNLYKNWHVKKDIKMIKRLQKLQTIELSDPHPQLAEPELRDRVKYILSALKKMKEAHENDQRLTPYYFLYDKAVFFTKTASKEQIRELLMIGESLLRPFKLPPP